MRKILLLFVLLAAVVAGGALLASRQQPRWTTDSEAALAAFESGLEASQKLYADEARADYQRAVELDPDFAAAKLYLLRHTEGRYDEGPKREMLEELRAIDRSKLSDRERLLIEFQLARIDGDIESAQPLLTRYLEKHPDDPFALDIECGQLWETTRFEEATSCSRRLIEIDPNWVRAQNLLGYMAMAQGDWQEAEEQFEIYRYLAPDQANPHDSLGELLLLTGRWDEARREFEEALAVKPEFCASWDNLMRLALAREDLAEARRLSDRALGTGACGDGLDKLIDCHIAVWEPFARGDMEATWQAYEASECSESVNELTAIAYQAALESGHPDVAETIRGRVEALHEKHSDDLLGAYVLYLEGVRLRLAGKPDRAVEALREADSHLAYWNVGTGFFKLANQLELARALRLAGADGEADRLLAEAEAINPPLIERWLSYPAPAPPGSQPLAAEAPAAEPSPPAAG